MSSFVSWASAGGVISGVAGWVYSEVERSLWIKTDFTGMPSNWARRTYFWCREGVPSCIAIIASVSKCVPQSEKCGMMNVCSFNFTDITNETCKHAWNLFEANYDLKYYSQWALGVSAAVFLLNAAHSHLTAAPAPSAT